MAAVYRKSRTLKRFILSLSILVGFGGCASSTVRAVLYGNKAQVEAWLNQGGNINAPLYAGGHPKYSQPPLIIAAYRHPEMTQFLIDKGADPNVRDHLGGTTALMQAADAGQVEIVKILLAAGADPLAVNNYGHTALAVAQSGEALSLRNERSSAVWNFTKIVKLLAEAEKKAKRKKERGAKKEATQADLEAQFPEIESAEKAGDEARQGGKEKEALQHYLTALEKAPRGSEPDHRLREKIIPYVLSLKSPPSLSEEARHHANRGLAFLKRAENREGFDSAISELEQALRLAPWWAEAYFNLGLVQEKAEEFDAAIQSLQFYLLAQPHSRDTDTVKKKIAELEVAQELA